MESRKCDLDKFIYVIEKSCAITRNCHQRKFHKEHNHSKLDLSPSVSVAYGDLNIDHRMERLKETFDSQPDHIKHQYIRRMEEITDL
ncbi:hypothetical protein LXL04_022318 [Taraxacum kok-saghyz]